MSNNNQRNPYNTDSVLYRRLTKIFSGPLNTRKQQNPHNLRRSNLNVYANRFKSLSGQSFKKSGYNPFQSMWGTKQINEQRGERYREFEQMEFMPELGVALDIYADEMTTSTQMSPVLNIQASNEEIKMILHNLYYNILNVEHNMFHWCRTMCKYGDFFLLLDIDDSDGVVGAYGLPTHEIERLEGEDQTNPNYIQFQWNNGGITFEYWQLAHFRILQNDRYAPYGTSVLEYARRPWRQLLLLEDAVIAYRVVRSPERRVFYIDVGNIPPEQVEDFIEKVKNNFKKHQLIDEDSGRVDLRYNALSTEDDYFIPVRGDSQTKIESIPGGSYTGDIEDVQYLQNKIFTSIKIPRAYLISDEKSADDKETLSQKDIHFARTIQRLQKPVISELVKIGMIHLMFMGYSEADASNFELSLNNPSKVADLQELDVLKTKVDVANSISEGHFSQRFVYENIFGISYQDMKRQRREMVSDAKFRALLAATEAGEEIKSLADIGAQVGGSDAVGADIGADDGGEDEDIQDDLATLGLGGDGGGGESAADAVEDDDGGLLAAPGRRDSYTTPGSNGKRYRPVTVDKRDVGARKRSMASMYAKEKGGNNRRNIYPGSNRSQAQSLLESIEKRLKQEQQDTYEEYKEDEGNEA